MIDFILGLLEQLPSYIVNLYNGFRIPLIAVFVVYLIALVFSGHFAYVVRWIYVLACVGALIYGYFQQKYVLMCLIILSLLLMILVKSFVAIVRSVRQRRIDAKIERKALEQAARRRGSFKNKQAYSGQKPKENESAMSKEEIEHVLTNVTSENALTDLVDDAPKDPLDEIHATKGELHTAAQTARIDTEAIEEALRAIEGSQQN